MSKVGGPGTTKRVIDSYGGVPCDTIRPDTAPNRPGEPCGEIHQHCRGHVRALGLNGAPPSPERLAKRGDPCNGKAMEGQLVCGLHGGKRKAALEKAERTMAAEAAAAAVNRQLGRPTSTPVTDPAAELARSLGQAVAWRDAAQALVSELEQAAQTVGDDDDDDLPVAAGVIVPTASGLDVHPLVKLAERAQDRVLKGAADMVKLGFVERRVQVEEAQAAAIEAALLAVLADHGIDPTVVLPDLAARLNAIETEAREAT